jgi:alkylmercury lyase
MSERDIRLLADAITEARPRISEADRRIIIELYRLLGRGEPVSVVALAERTGRSEPEVESTLHPWPGVFRDHEDRIVGFWGLTVKEISPHEIFVDGRKLWTWCAWDTLFLPRLLGGALDVRSRCPVTGRAVGLRVSPDEVETVEPAEVVVSFLQPNGRFEADMITTFCHYVHFFADEAAGLQWTSEHPGTFLLSPEEAFEIGRLTNQWVQS